MAHFKKNMNKPKIRNRHSHRQYTLKPFLILLVKNLVFHFQKFSVPFIVLITVSYQKAASYLRIFCPKLELRLLRVFSSWRGKVMTPLSHFSISKIVDFE